MSRPAGVPNALLENIEDNTAIMLAGNAAVVEFELFVRRMHRRGYIEDEELRQMERYVERASRAINAKLDYTRHLRKNPKEAIGE